MSNNDAVQPVDEISLALKEVDQWIVNIETLVQGYDTEEIPPARPPINEIPSIYGNWKRMDDFGDVKSFLPKTNRWRFISFMKRAFHLKVRECLEELQKSEDKVWRCYCGVDEQFRAENSKGFIEHLLVSSCFLIFALVILTHDWKLDNKIYESAKNDDTKMRELNEYKKSISVGEITIRRYMLTMDYQVPLFVVEAIYTKHSNLSSKFNTPIHELAISAFRPIHPGVHNSKLHNNTITVPQDGFQHLLHIFHWSRTPEGKFHETILSSNMKIFNPICSATEMQLSATVFDMHDVSGFDVTFNERILSGVMQLPPWYRALHEIEIYKNLLAFEQGYGRVCGFAVTAYIACIVHLVQTEQDVTLLQAKRLIPILGNQKDFLSSLQGYKTILLSNDIPVSNDLWSLGSKIRSHINKRYSIKKILCRFQETLLVELESMDNSLQIGRHLIVCPYFYSNYTFFNSNQI